LHFAWIGGLLEDKRALRSSAHSLPSGLSLRANFSWTFAGNVVYAGCQWGMLVVLAKLGSPEMVGQFALGLAVTAPVIMFANLNVRAVQATDARAEYLFGDYLGLRLITTALALLVIAGIVLVSGYRRETALVILAVGTAKAFEAISDAFYGLLQQRERMDRIAKSMMIKGPLSLLVLGVGVYLAGSVFWGAVGLAVAWALVLIGYDIRSAALILKLLPQPGGPALDGGNPKAGLRPRWEMRTLARLAWLALPLGLVMMLISLNTNIPRYFIEGYLGEYELGIFAAMAYLERAGATVASALGQSASPRLAKHYAAGNAPAYRSLLLKLIGIVILLGGAGVLVALVAGREILTLLYRPEYARPDVFVRLMVAVGLTYVVWVLGHGMTAARYFRVQLPVNVFVTIVAVLACIWLIPSGGLRGAATALIVVAVVEIGGGLAIVVHALSALHKDIRGG
jgi:O-antigen/teichoic acid export membrane protein